MEAQQSIELVIPQQLLCCKLCEDDLRKPKYLPCLHTFCFKCIEEHIDNKTDKDGFFPCPTCSTETTLSAQTVENLPDNILATRLATPAKEKSAQETLCRTCKNGGNFVEAVVHCTICDDILCQNCAESHGTQEETASHHTQSMEEYHRGTPSRPITPNQGPIIPVCCEYYDPYDIGALYCVDCDRSVCADCHIASHGEHRCAELMAVAGNFEQKIQEPLAELKNDSTVLTDALKDLDRKEQCIKGLRSDLKDIVKRRTKVLCDLIHDYECLLLEEIGKRFKQNKQAIKSQRNDINMHLEAIRGVKDFTDNLLNYGSYEEKVFMRKKVGFRIRELCEEPLLEETTPLLNLKLTEPNVTVETICDMYGDLKDMNNITNMQGGLEDSQSSNTFGHTLDSGTGSDVMDSNDPELVEIMNSAMANGMMSRSQSGSDTDILSNSNTSDTMRNVKFSDTVTESMFETEIAFNLENPKREIALPQAIQRECIKGMGINSNGDIIQTHICTTMHCEHGNALFAYQMN